MRYVVANLNRLTGEVVEVFDVTDLCNIKGETIRNKEEAITCVVRDGTCHHTLNLDRTPIYTVH